jgi:NADPH:quinone reductase-like Zn-dependent oxidoreductase
MIEPHQETNQFVIRRGKPHGQDPYPTSRISARCDAALLHAAGEIEDPEPASDEILVDLHATSVSFMDHLLVSSGYQMRPPTPFVPGTEGAGIVTAIGSGVTRFKPGDRVACGGWIGGYAERMVAK